MSTKFIALVHNKHREQAIVTITLYGYNTNTLIQENRDILILNINM